MTDALSEDPFGDLEPGQLEELVSEILKTPRYLLQIAPFRARLARLRLDRFLTSNEIACVNEEPSSSIKNTIAYNIEQLKRSVHNDRAIIMVRPLMGIEQIWRNLKTARVLSIGTRSEIELLALMGLGFPAENITAIDLFSYSPWIDVGDMHELPYPDNSFDVVLAGWVISYSKDVARFASEIVRVTAPGGIVAISADYSNDSTIGDTFDGDNTHIQSCDQILEHFDGRVGSVYFRHDPRLPDIRQSMAIFELTG